MISFESESYNTVRITDMENDELFLLWWGASRLVLEEERDRQGEARDRKSLIWAARQTIASLAETSQNNPESTAIAIFKGCEPKFFLHYLIHNDNPDPDYITFKLCQS